MQQNIKFRNVIPSAYKDLDSKRRSALTVKATSNLIVMHRKIMRFPLGKTKQKPTSNHFNYPKIIDYRNMATCNLAKLYNIITTLCQEYTKT